MAARVPYFELHIRPLFRLVDRDHMLARGRGLDLWSYDAVVRDAKRIRGWLRGGQPMPPPPPESSGPWPEEWIALFDRWVDLGCPRLQVGRAPNYVLESTAPARYRLSCLAAVSLPNCAAFFDLVDASPSNRTYLLYVVPPVPELAPSAGTARAIEVFRADQLARGVYVIDADVIDTGGKKFVALPSA